MANHKKSQNITIIDVARDSGVSYSTVSRVLNGYEFVKESTREKVLASAKALGYVANQQARSLAGGRSNIIGLLVPTLDMGYVATMARGVDEALSTTEYDIMLYTTHRQQEKEARYAKMIANGLSDGLLLLAPAYMDDYVDMFVDNQFPYVMIDQEDPQHRSSTIAVTNWQGAYDATQYLISLGHRRIAHIAGLESMSSAQQRLAGYRAALAEHNIAYHEELVISGEYKQKESVQVTHHFLDLDTPPTAIFAANDTMAFGAIEAAMSRDIGIPEQLSIIGFDDVPQAMYSYPKLTTIRQPLDQMGRTATRLLLSLIENPKQKSQQITLGTQLIKRDTCTPPLF